jgi:glycosyltransferase involved in cell wall biosynthesis
VINLSIVIPCYNEGRNIPRLINRINRIIDRCKINLQFIIVNNGSSDNTNALLTNLIKNKYKKFYKIIFIKKNIGYGGGILKGIFFSTGKIVAWTHADLQTDPYDIIKAYKKYFKKILNDKMIVKGLRENRKIFDKIFTHFMSFICYVIFKLRIKDINAQPKIFNRSFLKLLKKAPKDFSLDLFLLLVALNNNYTISNYPVILQNRIYGNAKGGGSFIGKFRLSIKTLAYMIKLKKYGYSNTQN